MAHYAFLDDESTVVEVIVGNDETTGDWETYYAGVRGLRCVRTSYHGRMRGKFAAIGDRYDEANDVFLSPSVDPSPQALEDGDNPAP